MTSDKFGYKMTILVEAVNEFSLPTVLLAVESLVTLSLYSSQPRLLTSFEFWLGVWHLASISPQIHQVICIHPMFEAGGRLTAAEYMQLSQDCAELERVKTLDALKCFSSLFKLSLEWIQSQLRSQFIRGVLGFSWVNFQRKGQKPQEWCLIYMSDYDWPSRLHRLKNDHCLLQLKNILRKLTFVECK